MKPLPKSLQRLMARYPERFSEGWTEQDDWNGSGTWSHWIWLKPGWRLTIDPWCALHAIHEPYVRDARKQFLDAVPCDCDECQRELTGK